MALCGAVKAGAKVGAAWELLPPPAARQHSRPRGGPVGTGAADEDLGRVWLAFVNGTGWLPPSPRR